MSYALIECGKRKWLPFIEIEEIFDEVHIVLPKIPNSKLPNYAKRIKRILKKYQVSEVILAKNLLENNTLKNSISTSFEIITGDRLMKALIKKTIFDICNVADFAPQLCKVAILVHEFSIENLHLVKYISKDVKLLSLITDNTLRYERVADDLLEKDGVLLSVFDINYKNIARCNFVVNVDFSEEEIKKLSVGKEAIVISLRNDVKALRNSFNGIIINDIDIYFDDTFREFRSLAVCEAQIYDFRKDFKENERRFDKAGYKMNGYITNHGPVTEEDIKRLFTKNSKNNT